LFNNLVMFDQHAKQNNMQSIVPDLATGWSWSEDGDQLTFPLREGVKEGETRGSAIGPFFLWDFPIASMRAKCLPHQRREDDNGQLLISPTAWGELDDDSRNYRNRPLRNRA